MNGLRIDLFAGGGGASAGVYRATGRHPNIAINHSAAAIAMHTAWCRAELRALVDGMDDTSPSEPSDTLSPAESDA